jgi:hypothetical protein
VRTHEQRLKASHQSHAYAELARREETAMMLGAVPRFVIPNSGMTMLVEFVPGRGHHWRFTGVLVIQRFPDERPSFRDYSERMDLAERYLRRVLASWDDDTVRWIASTPGSYRFTRVGYGEVLTRLAERRR